MRCSLPYGSSTLTLEIPDDRVAAHCAPAAVAATAATGLLTAALAAPQGLPPLRDLASGKRVTLLLSDRTRSTPRTAAGNALLEHLHTAAHVHIAITTGSHSSDHPADRALLDTLLAQAAAAGIPADGQVHDSHAGPFRDYGSTAAGTPVQLNTRAMDADLFAVHADMKPHYFAGYSNVAKHFLPGLSAYAGIERNHALALLPAAAPGCHPWHPDPARHTNPLAVDIADAFARATGGRTVFTLATIASGEQVLWAAAGAAPTVTAAGITTLDRDCAHALPPVSHVIISCGGYPLDETLYTAHAGLEMTRAIFRPGAEILLLAECRDGIAPNAEAVANFYQPLCARRAPPERSSYRLGAHKTARLAALRDCCRIHLHTALPDAVVAAAGFTPAHDPQALVAQWLADGARPAIISGANKLLLHPAP